MTTKNRCIHKYLTVYKTTDNTHGLGDFLRGTITLFKYSQIYGYDLFIDKNIHPFFSFLEDCQYLIADDDTNDQNVFEIIPQMIYPKSYIEIDIELNRLFRSGEDFSLITNAFYTKDTRVINNQEYFTVSNFGSINSDCKKFMKTILTPNDYTKQKLTEYYNNFNMNSDTPYTVIHLRFGDKYLIEGHFDNNLLAVVNYKIATLLSSYKEKQFILLTDSSKMGQSLKENNPRLFYKENKKNHMGDLHNGNKREDIEDTVVDFFVISRASEIYSMKELFESAFSKITCLIFDIEYTMV